MAIRNLCALCATLRALCVKVFAVACSPLRDFAPFANSASRLLSLQFFPSIASRPKSCQAPSDPPNHPNPLIRKDLINIKKLSYNYAPIRYNLRHRVKQGNSTSCNRHQPLAAFVFSSQLNSPKLIADRGPALTQDSRTRNSKLNKTQSSLFTVDCSLLTCFFSIFCL